MSNFNAKSVNDEKMRTFFILLCQWEVWC